ncbi:Na+-driven multidrug efflux pump [Staphylococcus hominis]
MSKSKKYFYISVILLIISFYFNTFNPLLSMQFKSIKNLLIACSIVNVVILIASIIFSDKAIKHLNNKNKDWIKTATKILPFVILIVILFHIFASVKTFGIFS